MTTTRKESRTERTAEAFIKIDEEFYSVSEARPLLGIPPFACFGCYLGDAAPQAHDICGDFG